VQEERVIRFRVRTVLAVLAIVLSVALLLQVIWLTRQVLVWILIAVFFALALNPLVEWLQRHGLRRRGLATGAAFLVVLGVVAGLGGTLVPTVVDEIDDFVQAVPGYIDDLTAGRGRLGFLQSEYQIVDRVDEAVSEFGAGRILGVSGTAIAVTKGVLTAVVAVVSIAVLTFFMLLEGPAWIERGYGLMRPEAEERWRAIGRDVYRTVGGFVTGALTIALIAGTASAIFLSVLGVQYAIAIGVLVAFLDLIPLAGATIATVLVTTIGFLDSVPIGLAILVFFVVYQQIENNVLYPAVYSRTVELSPLVILIAVLIGASLGGILGALGAIPLAGTIQVVLRDLLRRRRPPEEAPLPPPRAQPL
jgi:predicted PurR-regulated permease PerM